MVMAESHESFWDAISDDFMSEGAQLMYADWLLENGFEEAGEALKLSWQLYGKDRNSYQDFETWKKTRDRLHRLIDDIRSKVEGKGFHVRSNMLYYQKDGREKYWRDATIYVFQAGHLYNVRPASKHKVSPQELLKIDGGVEALALLLAQVRAETTTAGLAELIYSKKSEDKKLRNKIGEDPDEQYLMAALSNTLYEFESLDKLVSTAAGRSRNFLQQVARLYPYFMEVPWAARNMRKMVDDTKEVLGRLKKVRPTVFLRYWLGRVERTMELIRQNHARLQLPDPTFILGVLNELANVIRKTL